MGREEVIYFGEAHTTLEHIFTSTVYVMGMGVTLWSFLFRGWRR